MSSDVHVGDDGWMFLSGGSNEVLKYYSVPGFFDQATQYWKAVLRSRVDRARSIGATYRHMIVPDKISIYSEFYRDPLPLPRQAPTLALAAALLTDPQTRDLVDVLVDVRGRFLRDKAATGPLYWKTDAHWTFEGCYLAYLAFCESVEARPNTAIAEAPFLTGELFLDLGSKLDPPVSETYIVKQFIKGAERVFANELVLYKEREDAHNAPGLHVGSQVVFKNITTATDPRRIVLFGDSYSEYRTHQLTGVLAETFAETHFVWSSSVDWNYVQSVKPDIILTQMAERFMNLVPNDDLEIESFARDRLAAHLEA